MLREERKWNHCIKWSVKTRKGKKKKTHWKAKKKEQSKKFKKKSKYGRY